MAELDEEYLTWLYARIGDIHETNPNKTYWQLFRALHEARFVWLISNDDNRVEDGRYIRLDFLDAVGLTNQVDTNWQGSGASVLEVIFGLAQRLEFEAERTLDYWFWILLNNLNLAQHNDTDFHGEQVADILHNLIFRTYKTNGVGGFFPLRRPNGDQRRIEIWNQMSAYILEHE